MDEQQLPLRTKVNGFTAQAAKPEHVDAARDLMHRTFREDFGYEALQPSQQDTMDLLGVYLETPTNALFVAVDDATGAVIATCAARAWDRRHPRHPDWLHARYQEKRAVELLRCYTRLEDRRRGAQRELVELARRWVVSTGHYALVNLHTNAGIPGAEPFWRSVAYEMHDSRPCDFNTVHFELPLAWPVRGATGPAQLQDKE